MKLKEIMTRTVEVVHPTDSLQTAAQKMRDQDIGFLPVYEGDELIGVLTDRDLVVRAIAAGMNSKAILGRETATAPPIYCLDDQDVEDAVRLMNENKIRRLIILNRDDYSLVGIVSLGDLTGTMDDKMVGKVMQSVSTPVKSR